MAAWRSRSKRGLAPSQEVRRPLPQWEARRRRAARRHRAARRRPPWPRSPLSAPSAPHGPPCCPLPGLAAAPAAWRAAAWGRGRDPPATVRGRPQGGRRPCDVAARPTHVSLLPQLWRDPPASSLGRKHGPTLLNE
eukprot:scaffold10350_cov68-Phaeocystis_antarctica.AAC.2